MTRWAKDVTPQNVHSEYPRPQLVRPRWLNLNGVWQIDSKSSVEQPPQSKELGEKILVPFPIESALSGVMKPYPAGLVSADFQCAGVVAERAGDLAF